MIFTEPVFLIFFVVTFAAYWLLKGQEARLGVLLVASAVFYGWWDWRFLGLIGFVIVISWLAALRAGRLPAGTP
ncbi:MAG: MBOAT family protein, partial [Pseudomonadota bacterium]